MNDQVEASNYFVGDRTTFRTMTGECNTVLGVVLWHAVPHSVIRIIMNHFFLSVQDVPYCTRYVILYCTVL